MKLVFLILFCVICSNFYSQSTVDYVVTSTGDSIFGKIYIDHLNPPESEVEIRVNKKSRNYSAAEVVAIYDAFEKAHYVNLYSVYGKEQRFAKELMNFKDIKLYRVQLRRDDIAKRSKELPNYYYMLTTKEGDSKLEVTEIEDGSKRKRKDNYKGVLSYVFKDWDVKKRKSYLANSSFTDQYIVSFIEKYMYDTNLLSR